MAHFILTEQLYRILRAFELVILIIECEIDGFGLDEAHTPRLQTY